MKLILFFLSGGYWIITLIWNFLYSLGIFPSKKINIISICVGNLSAGGEGKTPMVIFLTNLLKEKYSVAILSRGYKRHTKGFKIANHQTLPYEIGDEPMQFFKRFGHKVVVSVCENRLKGAKKLKKIYNPDILILDDAYQHRRFIPEWNILLTDYNKPYYSDYLLPYGKLRESKFFSKRANCIVVTKCPNSFTREEKEKIITKLNPKSHQKIYFSSILYEKKIISNTRIITENKFSSLNVILITGIAKSDHLLNHIKIKFKTVKHKKFSDHHYYSQNEIKQIFEEYKNLKSHSKIILTTEKDYMKLIEFPILKEILFYLPISIKIYEQEQFIKQIHNLCGKKLKNQQII